MKPSAISLVDLLMQDGQNLIPAGSGEYKTLCWAHDDKNPSMSINDAEGVYHCFSCGASGNAYTYLLSHRKLASKQAVELLGWSDDRVELASTELESAKTRLADEPVIEKPKLHEKPSPTNWDGGKVIAQYDYLENGELFCSVVKYDDGRKILPFTPVEGGYYCCWPTSKKIPHTQRKNKLILYGVDQLKNLPVGKQQVWVVEGEKDVVSVKSVFKSKVVVSAPSGTHIKKTLNDDGEDYELTQYVDWSPLFGHRILLISDADNAGRDYMKTLGKYLHSNHCEVRLVLPSGDDKFDISDAINSGRTSGSVPKAVEKWINSCAPFDIKVLLENERQEIKRPSSNIAHSEFYKILGLGEDKTIWFRLFATNEIVSFGRSSLTDMRNLILIAPPEYWYELAGGVTVLSASNAIQIASSMIRCAEDIGMVAWNNILDVGAAYDAISKKYYYNLGDRILCGNKTDQKMTAEIEIHQSKNIIFRPGEKVKLVERDDASILFRDFTAALAEYRWETPDCCRCVVGWIVTSIIGGALGWRPNIWLLAGTDTGKSFLLEHFIQPIIGSLSEMQVSPSDAGINQSINSSSVPIIIDEFESGDQGIQVDKFRNLLKMIRYASGNVGVISRGSAIGKARQMNPRFSTLVASVSIPSDVPPQDENRFAFVRLSPIPIDNYKEKERAILASLAGDKALAIRTHIIRSLPEIVAKYESLCRMEWTQEHTPRDVKILAALSAGWWFASGKKEIITARDRADEGLRVDKRSAIFNIMETILLARIKHPHKNIDLSVATALKNRYDFVHEYGVRLFGNNEAGNGILLAIGSKQIKSLMKDSIWARTSLGEVFRSWPDVKPQKKSSRFGQFTHRCVWVPEYILEEVGFSTLITDEDDIVAIQGNTIRDTSTFWQDGKN